MTYKVRVTVKLKTGVADPEGMTIADAAHSLGFSAVASVSAGKSFDLVLDASSDDEATRLAKDLAQRLLANLVLETFEVSSPVVC